MSCAEQPCYGEMNILPYKPKVALNGEQTLTAVLKAKLAPPMPMMLGQTVYLRHAFFHPVNLLMLFIAATFGIFGGSLWLLLVAGGAEAMAMVALPRNRLFRSRVDATIAEEERAEIAKLREQLLVQMSEGHRQELEQLEMLIARTRDNARRRGGPIQMMVEEQIDLDQLLANYIRLAISHRERTIFLAQCNRRFLEEDRVRLELQLEECDGDVRKLIIQRLSIALKRQEQWSRTRENLDLLEQQLSTISELIHLTYEQSMTPFGCHDLSGEIELFMDELAQSESTMREIAALGVDDLALRA